MKNIRVEGSILIATGLIIIGAALFVYFVVDKGYPNADSSRVQHLNWLLKNFGKTGSAFLIAFIGIFPLYFGVKRLMHK